MTSASSCARQRRSIRRHRRSGDEAVLAQVRFREGPQLLLRVPHQHLKRVVVQKPAGDGRAVARDDAIRSDSREGSRRRDRAARSGAARACESRRCRSGPARDASPCPECGGTSGTCLSRRRWPRRRPRLPRGATWAGLPPGRRARRMSDRQDQCSAFARLFRSSTSARAESAADRSARAAAP